jgi:hypothetical protein
VGRVHTTSEVQHLRTGGVGSIHTTSGVHLRQHATTRDVRKIRTTSGIHHQKIREEYIQHHEYISDNIQQPGMWEEYAHQEYISDDINS